MRKLCGLTALYLIAALLAIHGVLGDDIQIDSVSDFSAVKLPETPAGRPECVVRFNTNTPAPLSSKSVVIMFDEGAAAYDTRVAWQYYNARGAHVTFGCVNATQANVFLEAYYPVFKQTCTLISSLSQSNYHVVFVPGGYQSILSLRVNEDFNAFIRSFTTSLYEVNTALVVAAEATEVLIDSDILELIPVGAGSDAKVPVTTKAVENAFSARGISISSDVDTAVFNINRNNTADKQLTNIHRFVGIGGSQNDINALLRSVSSQVLGFPGDIMSVDCASDIPLANFSVAPFEEITKANFPELAVDTNLESSVVKVSLDKSCVNPSGTNFCKGRKISIIVAHGTHDVEVSSAVKAYQDAGAIVRIFCPDDLLLGGFVYLMPRPARTVTHTVKCTRYYNSSMLATQSLVIVPSGPVATHRRLQHYDKLIEVMQYTGTFSLFGSAMVLLTTQDIKEKLTNVPYCLPTNKDLMNVGFSINTSSAPIFVRNTAKGRSKLLAGYQDATQDKDFSAFLNQSVFPLVWRNEKQPVGDRIFGAIYIAIGCLSVVIVVAVLCVRSRQQNKQPDSYAVANDNHRDYDTANDVY